MAPPRCCPQALRRPGPLPPAPYAARRAKQWVRTGTTGLPSPASGRSGLSPRSIGKKGGSFLGVWTAALLGLRGPSRRRPALGKARRGGQKGRWTLHCVHPAVPLLGPLIGEGVAGRLAPGREGGRLQAKQAQGDPLRGRRGVTTQRAPAHVRPPGCLSDQLRVPCLSHQWQRGRGGHHLELESSRTPVLHRGSAGAPPTWKAPSLVPHEPGASRSGPWMGSACLPRSRGPACLAPCRAVVRPCGWLSAHPPAGVCRARQPWRPGSPIGSGNASLSSSTFFCSVSRFLLLHPVPRPARHPAVCRT